MYYMYFEAEQPVNPKTDPIVLWLQVKADLTAAVLYGGTQHSVTIRVCSE